METIIDNIWLNGKFLSAKTLNQIERNSIGFEIEMKMGDGKDSNLIFMQSTVRIINHNKNDEIYGSIEILVAFKLMQEKKEYTGQLGGLDKSIRNRLIEEVVGICRGIIFSEFSGTVLKNAVLPFVTGEEIMARLQRESAIRRAVAPAPKKKLPPKVKRK